MAIQCPYCGEAKSEAGLRGHVMLETGNQHGPFGRLPEDYESNSDIDDWEALRRSELQDETEETEAGLISQLGSRLS